MFNAKTISIAALLLVGLPASAQIKITGLAQAWYTQMLDDNLRLNSRGNTTGGSYYNLRSEFTENTWNFRRVEVKFADSIGKNIDWEIMIDPTIDASVSGNSVLQDVFIRYKLPAKIEIKVGQFKNIQTLEGATSSSDLLFAERSQLARVFGDVRDRGVTASIGFGDANAFGGRFHVGVFNAAGKGRDQNAQKDFAARLEMNYGKEHTFGGYALQGSTDLADKGALRARAFAGTTVPTDEAILDNKDATSNFGAFYRFQNKSFHISAEFISGILGRRNPSLVVGSGNASREHLDQAFLGYVGTFAYTFGNHTLLARYDSMDYNATNEWYTDSNPYLREGVDFSPKYDEITVGYSFAFLPERFRAANIKLNYVMRSKNFMQPRAGQIGEQGGDSVVAVFQIAF